jgi:hypothetical protein
LLGILFAYSIFFSTASLAKQQEVTVGAYLTSLYDINNDDGTFSADLWIWSKSKGPYDLAKSLEVSLLSSKVPHLVEEIPPRNIGSGVTYAQKKVEGTFIHDYDMRNFPFDTQRLSISLEDADLNLEALVLKPDPASGFDKEISVDGWNILSAKIRSEEKVYDTNFGDDSKPNIDKYSKIILDIDLQRDDKFIFFKITLGLFAAVFVALFSNFMSSANADIYSNRVGLVGASLLAVVVNQQFADQKIGQTTTVTLVDLLHMAGFCTVFIIFICALISRKLSLSRGAHFSPKEFDTISFVIMAITYIALNLYLIFRAIGSS